MIHLELDVFVIVVSGCENTDSGVGIYASDPDAYTTFAPLLDPIIKDYHKVSELKHPEPDFGDIDKLDLGDLDPSGNMIVSTRIRIGRNHDSFGFPAVLTSQVSCIHSFHNFKYVVILNKYNF